VFVSRGDGRADGAAIIIGLLTISKPVTEVLNDESIRLVRLRAGENSLTTRAASGIQSVHRFMRSALRSRGEFKIAPVSEGEHEVTLQIHLRLGFGHWLEELMAGWALSADCAGGNSSLRHGIPRKRDYRANRAAAHPDVGTRLALF
jgi:hypothetical protein